jgi:reactive intermediate/imine deaminase
MRSLTLLLLAVMSTQAPSKEVITIGKPPAAPYSQAIKAGGLIYVSGTLAQDASGAIVGKGDVGAQTTRVLERVSEVLTAAGSSLDQAVAVTVYLKSVGDFAAMNQAYRTFWKQDPPTRTTVIADSPLPEALIEISVVAVPRGAQRIVILPDGWKPSPNPYSYAIKTGETVFLSGLVARNGKDNTFVDGNVASQTATILDNASEVLKAAGLTFANVVSSRVFLTSLEPFQEMNGVYRKYFTSSPPARATVRAGLAGPQALVEITLVASTATKEVVSDGRATNPNLSAAIRAGSKLYVSGMLGNTPETKGDAGAQTRETLARIGKALEAGGCTPADVVDSLVYVTDLQNYGAMNEVYRPFFEKNFPARATVQSGLVGDGLVEIMVSAECPKK